MRPRSTFLTCTLALLALAGVVACGAAPESQPPAAEAPPATPAEPASPDPPEEPVEVAAEGTELEPPVEIERLPDGVWYCDMGTAHYAQAEAGDCPRCGMTLVQKTPDETDESAGT